MASSKLVTTNPDLPRDSSSSSSSSSSNSLSTLLLHLPDSDLHHHLITTSATFSMDDLLNSIYPSTTTPPPPSSSDAATPPPPPSSATKTVDDVWKEIVAGTATGTHSHSQRGSDGAGEGLEAMTLEDFLTKAGAVREEDVRGGVLPPTTPSSSTTTTTTTTIAAAQFAMPVEGSSSVEAFGNGVDGNVVGGVAASASASAALVSGGGGGKGKRRAVEEPVDKATLQKQRRMIKNRESAARSRERKQAYTTELEYLVQQLEQENARLLSEEAEKQQQRYKQLMECLIPIEERREPKRRLRRTNSVQSM